jgi:hypothetical protein
MNSIARFACGMLAFGVLAGCEGRPSLIPNSDPNLRGTSTQFAADAARRFPYPAAAEKAGDAQGRAQVDLMMAELQLLNYDNQDWSNIDLWVNKCYVVHIPKISKAKEKVETINFGMLYDAQGHSFSTDGGKNPMKQVEIVRDGKVYQIPLALAD